MGEGKGVVRALDAVVVLDGGEHTRLLDELALLLGARALRELFDRHALLHEAVVRRRARAGVAILADPNALQQRAMPYCECECRNR